MPRIRCFNSFIIPKLVTGLTALMCIGAGGQAAMPVHVGDDGQAATLVPTTWAVAAVPFSAALRTTELDAIRASDANLMMFYADWCSACKILDPKLVQAVETYKSARINIVRLDYTRGDIAGLSRIADQTEALGMADEVSAASAKTGYALIIMDGASRGRIGAGMNVDSMHLLFDAALGKTPLTGTGL